MKNRKNLIPFKKIQKDWMKDSEYRREYEKLEPEFQIARQMMAARLKKKMSQQDLAKKAGTGQAVISRLEGMNAKPSLSLLKRIAEALETEISFTVR